MMDEEKLAEAIVTGTISTQEREELRRALDRLENHRGDGTVTYLNPYDLCEECSQYSEENIWEIADIFGLIAEDYGYPCEARDTNNYHDNPGIPTWDTILSLATLTQAVARLVGTHYEAWETLKSAVMEP